MNPITVLIETSKPSGTQRPATIEEIKNGLK